MNIPLFDQTKMYKDDGITDSLTTEAEAIRLSNELRTKPAHTFIAGDGTRVDVPIKRGFNCETADFTTIINWLADTRIKKSESLIAFVHRILAVRFPTEYSQHKGQIDNRYKLEYELIQANAKNDIFDFGKVGFSQMVRLDGSLTCSSTKAITQRNGEVKIVRK